MKNEYIGKCTTCGKENVKVNIVDEVNHLCEDCIDEDYFYCEECNQYWHYDFVEFFDLDDGRTVCEHCYKDIRAESTEAKLEALIHEISERDDFEVYEAGSVFFIVSNDFIKEIPNDASCSPKGGWFPDIVRGLSKEESDKLETLMEDHDFSPFFFDDFLSEYFEYDEDSAREYFEEQSDEDKATFERILKLFDSENPPYDSIHDLISAMKRCELESDTLYYEWEGEWIPFYENIVDTGEDRGYYESMSDEEWLRILENIDSYRVEGT